MIELYIDSNNNIFWYFGSKNHNKYSPAIRWADDSKEWFYKNTRHRVGGPAVVRENGYVSWYLNGVKYTHLEYLVAVEEYKLNKELNGN